MPLGAPTLARERTHLALHFVDQVIETGEVNGRFLETALGAAATIAIQADTSRLFEQLATFVGPVREQGIDHPAFDDDAGIGAESRATHQILDVAQTARRAIQEILTFPRTHQAPRDDDFLERDREVAFRVIEMQRHFGHVHGFP